MIYWLFCEASTDCPADGVAGYVLINTFELDTDVARCAAAVSEAQAR